MRIFRKIHIDFFDYQDEEVQDSFNWHSFEKLAVQVESMRHLDGSPCGYDLIICDEIESILYQFSSSTHKDAHWL